MLKTFRKRNSLLALEVAASFAGSVGQAGARVVALAVILVALPTGSVAGYFLATSLVQVVAVVGRLGQDHLVIRWLGQRAELRTEPVPMTMVRRSLAGPLAFGAVLAVLSALLVYSGAAGEGRFDQLGIQSLLIAALLLSETVRPVVAGIFTGRGQVGLSVVVGNPGRFILQAIMLLAVWAFAGLDLTRVLVILMSSSVICLLLGYSLIPVDRSTNTLAADDTGRDGVGGTATYGDGSRIMAISLSQRGVDSIALWVVNASLTAAATAHLGTGIRLASLVAIPLVAQNRAVARRLAGELAKGATDRASRIAGASADLALVASLVAVLAVTAVAGGAGLWSDRFDAGTLAWVTFAVGVGRVMSAACGPCTQLLLMGHREAAALRFGLIGGAVTLALVGAAAFTSSVIAVAFALGVGMGVANMLYAWEGNRQLHVRSWATGNLNALKAWRNLKQLKEA